MKDEMKLIYTNSRCADNIHYRFKTIQGIKGFEDLTHFLVGDLGSTEFAQFNVVKFGTQNIIMTPSFCRFILENLDLTKTQKEALEEYMDIIKRLSPRVYTKLFTKLEDYIKHNS